MAAALVQQSPMQTTNNSPASQIILPAECTPGNRVFACVAWYRSDTQNILVNLDGLPFGPFEFGAGVNDTDLYTCQVFSLLVPSPGLDTISIASTGNSFFRWVAAEFSGLDIVAPLDQVPAQTNTPNPNPATITSAALAQEDELVMVANVNTVNNGGVSGWAAPDFFTPLLSVMGQPGGPNGFVGFRNVASVAPVTATMNAPGSLNFGRMAMGTYKAAPPSSISNNPLMMGFSL
jgi:hypothetical protein